MDDDRFDALTRRRFGLAAGGLAAALGGLIRSEDAEAKHKHRHRHRHKKTCTSQQTRCGKKCVDGDCCPGQPCGESGFDCECGLTIDGKTFCFQKVVALCRECTSDADCSDPFHCVQLTDCGPDVAAICLPACGSVAVG